MVCFLLLKTQKALVKQGLLCWGAKLLPQYGSPCWAAVVLQLQTRRQPVLTADAATRLTARSFPCGCEAPAFAPQTGKRSRQAAPSVRLPLAHDYRGQEPNKKATKKQTTYAVCFFVCS